MFSLSLPDLAASGFEAECVRESGVCVCHIRGVPGLVALPTVRSPDPFQSRRTWERSVP
jgi:hypothetical protein